MINMMTEKVTIRRSAITVTDQRILPQAWTTVATDVLANIQEAGSTEQALVTGLAPQKAYKYWMLTTDLEPEDEVIDSNNNKYRVVTVER